MTASEPVDWRLAKPWQTQELQAVIRRDLTKKIRNFMMSNEKVLTLLEEDYAKNPYLKRYIIEVARKEVKLTYGQNGSVSDYLKIERIAGTFLIQKVARRVA